MASEEQPPASSPSSTMPSFLLGNHFNPPVRTIHAFDQVQERGEGMSKVLRKRTSFSSELNDDDHSGAIMLPPKKRRLMLSETEHISPPTEKSQGEVISCTGVRKEDLIQQTFQMRLASSEDVYVQSKPGTTNSSCDIDELDRPDLNVSPGVEYMKELYEFFKQQERVHRPTRYMVKQCGLDDRKRAELVVMLLLASDDLGLKPETLYMAMNIVDRYLSLEPVAHGELPMVGISSLLLATKYEEDWVPTVDKFVAVSKGACTRQEICFWEKCIVTQLDWYLSVPTIFVFLVRFAKAANADEEMEKLIYFYGELALMEYSFIAYCPSMIAASVVYAARLTLKRTPYWTDMLQLHASYSDSQLLACAQVIIHSCLSEPTDELKNAVYERYLRK